MDSSLLTQVREVVSQSAGTNFDPDSLTDDFPLLGNLLDSMAVTRLILALEEQFGFIFDDEELTAEAFETIQSVAQLVHSKLRA